MGRQHIMIVFLLSIATFIGGCEMGGGVPKKTVYAYQDLQGRSFVDEDLTSADFKRANLSDANLHFVKAANAKFTGADLSGADLSEGDFSFADFTDVNFAGANLTKANFTGAFFTGASFVEVIATGADFRGAKGLTTDAQFLLRKKGAVIE